MSDLISREALKKNCAEVVKASNNSDFIPCPTWNKAMELIDNAPAVYPICEDKACKYRTNERPQGEWIKKFDEVSYWYECDQCGERPARNYLGDDYLSRFCPNCGANMEGGAE